jgi:ATP-dependent Clp protease ATP-binding subunit ClpC
MLDHDYIGTEHILLGLIHEGDGVAAKALESLGISLEAVRQQVKESIGQGQQAPSGHIPFTPPAKKVLQLSRREALQLGHSYIGTEHLLLGLIREGEGVAAQVLVRLGADLNRVRQQVIQLLHGHEASGRMAAARAALGGGLADRGQRKRAARILDQLDAIESRLSALERRVGAEPEVRELDQTIARVREDKESAIDVQDFEGAAQLRDQERQLVAERDARQRESAAFLDRPSLAEELERLRSILRQHGIDPQDGAA